MPHGFLYIQTSGIEKLAAKWRKIADTLPEALAEMGPRFEEMTVSEALPALYGPELGTLNSASDTTHPGAFWTVNWARGGSGTIGVLRVVSDHPYVMGYEFGVPPHEIHAKNVANLNFFWERMGTQFVGPMVHHPGYQGKHKRELLAVWVQQMARFGWSSALNSAFTGQGTVGFVYPAPASSGATASASEMASAIGE